MDDFEIELKQEFLQEATQLLADAEQCFLGLEANPDDTSLLENIFRLAHNIKGSSKAVGFDQLGSFTHEFESFFLKIKNRQIATSPAIVSLLLRCNDQIRLMVDGLKSDLTAQFDVQTLIQEMQSASTAEASPAPAPTPAPAPAAETIIEEPLPEVVIEEVAAEAIVIEPAPTPVAVATPAPAPAPIQTQAAPKQASSPTAAAAADESIRVSLERVESLINYVGEMSILQAVLQKQVQESQNELLKKAAQQLGKVCKEVQDLSMSLRMVPIKQTFQKMQRIVRDTSSLLGKKTQLILQGEETELDKTVLESIGDPLVHLIRNAVDHGIESAETRVQNGKPEMGTIWLRSFHQAGKLVIEVQDDGGGINGAKLLAKAIEKGVLKAGTQLSEQASVNLVFHAGFSTKSEVSEVSGRGVGMDVVKTNIERLKGSIQIQTKIGQGSIFRIELPLTLAIIDGMVIRQGNEKFILPLSQVHESLKPAANELHFRTGVGEVLQLRGEVMPAHRLSNLISRPVAKGAEGSEKVALVFRLQGKPFSVLVDEILWQQEVVIKQLGPELRHLSGYSGSAILGDGKPALILEISDLVARHIQSPSSAHFNTHSINRGAA